MVIRNLTKQYRVIREWKSQSENQGVAVSNISQGVKGQNRSQGGVFSNVSRGERGQSRDQGGAASNIGRRERGQNRSQGGAASNIGRGEREQGRSQGVAVSNNNQGERGQSGSQSVAVSNIGRGERGQSGSQGGSVSNISRGDRGQSRSQGIAFSNISQGGIIQYICREEKEQIDCRLARQELKTVRGEQIRFFMDQIHNEAFTDFLDFFTDARYLYLVMNHSQEESLARKLKERCSLRERMEIGKNLLEYMVLQNLPEYFFQAAMDLELITVSRSLEVKLGYDLGRMERFWECDFRKGAQKLAGVLSELFERELTIRAFPPMETLIYDLRDNRFFSLLEIYGRFQEIYRKWANRKQEQLKPESFSFRLWERIKQIGRLLKGLAAAGILGLAVLYLVFSIMEMRKEPGFADNYNSIGTLKIQRPSDSKEEAKVQTEVLGE